MAIVYHCQHKHLPNWLDFTTHHEKQVTAVLTSSSPQRIQCCFTNDLFEIDDKRFRIYRFNSSHLFKHIGLCWQRWDSFSILRNSGKTLEKHLRSSSDLCNVITELTAFYHHLLGTRHSRRRYLSYNSLQRVHY